MKALIIVFMAFMSSIQSFSQWVQLQTGTAQGLNDICFINEFTGTAVGSNGIILRTTNSGLNWLTIPSPTIQNIYSTCFPSISTGYASGQTGFVIKTSNGGSSWFSAASCGINVRSISFINSMTGITGGGGTLMCYTTDGASSWNPRYTPTPHAVTGVHFFNASLLIVSATDMPGSVLHLSANGGNSWLTVLTLNNSGLNIMYSLSSVYFKDENTGFATGNYQFYGQNWGQIYRSTNGGNNWELIANIGPSPGNSLNAVYFGDNTTGFAAGSNGIILRSTNGGANWENQISGTAFILNSIYMQNDLTGYICGTNGLILKTTNGGITGIEPLSNEIPVEYKLYQNYPNPFNPVTKIKFNIPLLRGVDAEGMDGLPAAGRGVLTKLVIYDILGCEVATLVNEQLQPGTFEVEWDGANYPSGVYFYKLYTGDFSETKRMTLIK